MNKPLFLFLLFLMINSAFGQGNEHQLEGVDQEIETLFKAYNAVGLSVAVVKNDSVLYAKGFGYRNLEKQLPVTTNTVFPIGSVSKAFTASLLGVLESEGKISMKEKPALYIPGLQFYSNRMDELIEIEDLLSHKSGIGNQGTSLSLFPEKDKFKTVLRLKYLKPEGAINDSWHYSNMGYTIAGTIVEQVSGESWDANIKSRIFVPLKMKNSFTSLDEMLATSDFSAGYGVSKGETEEVLYERYYAYAPAGGIKSTAKDMCHWISAWLNKGKFKDRQVLPEEYVKAATSMHNIRPQSGASQGVYLFGDGFGWRVESYNGHYKVHHGGNTSGFSSHLVLFPNEEVGIVVLTNQDDSILPYIVSDLIARRMLGLPRPELKEYPILVGDIYKPSPKEESINREKKPTHDLDDFSGRYSADGYGTIEVKNKEQGLFVKFPTFEFQLVHLNFNSFYMKGIEPIPQIMDPEFTLQFIVDRKGAISKLKLYSQKEPIEFVREWK